MKEWELLDFKAASVAVVFGLLSALAYMFIFPENSIRNMVHYDLGLPGPGPGVAMILGPFAIVFMTAASRVTFRIGSALMTALAFAVGIMVWAKFLDKPLGSHLMLGSPLSILAFVAAGAAADLVVGLGEKLGPQLRILLSGLLANICLLVFYWVMIFPDSAGRVLRPDIPIIMTICVVCGLVAAVVGWLISGFLAPYFARD